MIEQRFPRHSVVRIDMIGGHGAFVSPEHPRLLPRKLFAVGRFDESSIKIAGRRAPRERPFETSSRQNRRACTERDLSRRLVGERRAIVKNAEFAAHVSPRDAHGFALGRARLRHFRPSLSINSSASRGPALPAP